MFIILLFKIFITKNTEKKQKTRILLNLFAIMMLCEYNT